MRSKSILRSIWSESIRTFVRFVERAANVSPCSSCNLCAFWTAYQISEIWASLFLHLTQSLGLLFHWSFVSRLDLTTVANFKTTHSFGCQRWFLWGNLVLVIGTSLINSSCSFSPHHWEVWEVLQENKWKDVHLAHAMLHAVWLKECPYRSLSKFSNFL